MNDSYLLDTVVSCLANATAPPPDFDYTSQPFVLQAPSGDMAIANTADITRLQNTMIITAAVFATQLGATLTIATVMLLMTSSEKRKCLSFVFNLLALICDIIRCICELAQLTSGVSSFVVIQLSLFAAPGMDEAIAIGVVGILFTFLLFVFIEVALIVQVRVVCIAASRISRRVTTALVGVVGAVAIGFRCHLTALNIHDTVHIGDVSAESQAIVTRAQHMSNISAVVSITIFSLIFCYKLFSAIRMRYSLGLKRFGVMQVIFIMGCQTLIVPVIFAICAYYAIKDVQLQSCVETVVAVSLPLSSIWAAADLSTKNRAGEQGAIIPLPVYRPTQANVIRQQSLTSDTLIGRPIADDGELQADERFFRSKYDLELTESTISIDKHLSVVDASVEGHAAV